MDDLDVSTVLERGTALLWFLLALTGIVLRLRRLARLNRIILSKPEVPEDADYLQSVKQSTYYRLLTKVALLIGATIALFQITDIVLVWRFAVIVALLFMIAETTGVDGVRARLARNAAARRRL